MGAAPAELHAGPRRILRERRAFRYLWLSELLSNAGTGASVTALVLYAQATRGSGGTVALLLAAVTVPRLLGVVTGALADRLEQRRLMVVCNLGQGVLFCAVALLPPFGLMLALLATASLLQSAYAPSRSSATPALVEEEELLAANGLMGTALNMQVAIGPLIGGLLVQTSGTAPAILVDAASFFGAALLLAPLPPLHQHVEPGERPAGLLHESREGLAHALHNDVARAVILSLFLLIVFAGIDNVALVFLVRDTLDSTAAGYGFVSAAFGVGMLAAALGLSARARSSAARVYIQAIALTGVGTLFTGLAPSLAFAVGLQFVAGAGNGAENVASDTLIQRHVPRRLLGRVFGVVSSGAYLASGLAYGAAAVLLAVVSPRLVFVIGGIGSLVGLVLAAPALLRAERD